jgi:hypothetical protein
LRVAILVVTVLAQEDGAGVSGNVKAIEPGGRIGTDVDAPGMGCAARTCPFKGYQVSVRSTMVTRRSRIEEKVVIKDPVDWKTLENF